MGGRVKENLNDLVGMSGSLRVCLVQAGLLGFTKEVRASSKRYLCFTKYAEEGGKKLLAIW